MTFEKYAFSKTANYTKVELPFGTYYLFEKFFIGELNEGIHFDWDMKVTAINKLIEFYGTDAKIGYISNRINNYSVDPSNWTKVEEKYNLFVASAIVIYNNSNYMNASIEKQFTNNSIKRCMSLQEAIEWMTNLREFN